LNGWLIDIGTKVTYLYKVTEGIKYDQLLLYYFSGTGNAKMCAHWFAEKAREGGLDTHLINIDRFSEIILPEHSGKRMIGFFSPTHGFNLPPIMLKFISRFPKNIEADVFILNTRAGMKLYKFFLPGLSGVAQFFPALILKIKGYSIIGMQPIDLPSNWVFLHPGLRKKVVLSMIEKHQRIVGQFADKLLSGGKKYMAFWSFPFDLLIAPVALGYYFVGRFFLAKTLFATSRCNACMLCVENCPTKAIKWIDDRPFWTWKCESCMRCINRCPERAIQTAHGFTAFILYLSTLVSAWIFTKIFVNYTDLYLMDKPWLNDLLWNVLISCVLLILVFFAYRLMHYCLQFGWFSGLMDISSLSRWRWWRRYLPNKLNRKKNRNTDLS
jgi:Pyruvate/2-oxoacid:ferredoxin oxidoreductase delta subunit